MISHPAAPSRSRTSQDHRGELSHRPRRLRARPDHPTRTASSPPARPAPNHRTARQRASRYLDAAPRPAAALAPGIADLLPAARAARDELHGVGPNTAALLLIAAGDHPGRLRSEAAWAHLCGVAPIPASSGKTIRHRLNPGGDRQANHALWRIVFTRPGSHPATRTYAERRTQEGKSKAEIIRCLKRYVAREACPHLRPTAG